MHLCRQVTMFGAFFSSDPWCEFKVVHGTNMEETKNRIEISSLKNNLSTVHSEPQDGVEEVTRR